MADFFAKGNKPINGYGGQDHGIVELWKNPSPTASFEGQSVDITSALNLDAFEVDYGESGYFESTARGAVGEHLQGLYFVLGGNGKIQQRTRDCTITKNGNTYSFTFTDANNAALNTYGSAPTNSTMNTTMIPVRILGLIHND